MKILMTTITFIIAFSLITTVSAKAKNPTFIFDRSIAWAGTGCEVGKGAVKGLNTDTFTVIFASYEASKGLAASQKRTACSFAIPIKLPKGFQISSLDTEWEGYVKGKGKFSRMYFVSGSPLHQWKRNNYNEPAGKTYVIKEQNNIEAIGCGGAYNLRINSNLRVMEEGSYIQNKKLTVKLRIKACK